MRKGQRFLHSRVLDSTYELSKQRVPQLFEVTAVRQGLVYYKPIYSVGEANERMGKAECALKSEFDWYVREYVDLTYRPPIAVYSDFSGR